MTALKAEHKRGRAIKITNAPILSILYLLANGDEGFPNKLSYASVPTLTADVDIATKKYIDDIAISGSPDASETVKGIVEQATLAETLAGTESGSEAKLFVTPKVLQSILQGQASTYLVEDGAGADDAYTTTATPTLASYTTGQVFTCKFAVANTGACTLDIDSVAVTDIKKWANGAKVALETGDIIVNYVGLLEYDGTDFMLLSMTATMPTTALLSEMATFFGATDITGAEAETLTDGSNADAEHTHSFNTLRRLKTLASHQLGEDDAEVASASTTGNFTKTNQTMVLNNGGGGGGTYVHWNDVNVDDWSNDANLDIFAGFNTATNLIGFIGFGLATETSPSSTTQVKRHVGFLFNASGEVFASMADGTTQELSTDIGITITNTNHFRIEFTGGTSAKFYVNETLVATLSTNPPASGSTDYSTAHLSAYGASTIMTATYPVLGFVVTPLS